MNPEDLTAREEIRHLLATYHLAGDRGRVDELVETFADAGVLELASGAYQGRDAIRERLSQVGGDRPPLPEGARPFLHHHLTTSFIDVLGANEARGLHYFLVMSPVGIDHCGRYDDTYVLVGDNWLISRRKALVSWASPDSILGARAT